MSPRQSHRFEAPPLWISIVCVAFASLVLHPIHAAETDDSRTHQATTAGANDRWRLVWVDEFNEDGRPRAENWSFEHGFVRNEELQWYQPDNARCEGGLLIIEGRRERKANPRYRPESRSWRTNREFAEYTSACLHTKGIRSWQYGRFDPRID